MPTDTSFCAVIPAAGRGSRLGVDVPKIMVELDESVSVWRVLHDRLRPRVQHLHVVVAPAAEAAFRAHAAADVASGTVSISVQREPRGMGDAIFGAESRWRRYDAILVVWGDQVNLSQTTVCRVVEAHRRATAAGRSALTLPLVPMADPYVEYDVERAAGGHQLTGVRMSREGDTCRPGGLSDVGVFCLSSAGLAEAWSEYVLQAPLGTATGEQNFLPFLPFLGQRRGWHVEVVAVADPVEARGINTPEDLAFAREVHRRGER